MLDSFKIDDLGNITLSDGSELKTIDMNNGESIILKNEELEITVTLDQLRIYLYRGLSIDVRDIDKIVVFYTDGDENNKCSYNLEYQFREPLESTIEGFYYIPNFNDKVISKSGELYTLVQNRKLEWRESIAAKSSITGGYLTQNFIHNLTKRRYGTSRHRAMALAFILSDSAPSKLIVNHDDGIPGNDSIDNLEWNTYSENVGHAYINGLHPNKTRAVKIKDISTSKVYKFNTIAECARFLNLTHSRLSNYLSSPSAGMRAISHPKFTKGFVIENVASKTNYVDRVVYSLNTLNGEITIFSDSENCAKITGLELESIERALRYNRIRPLVGMVFRYKETLPFPKYNEYQLEMIREDINSKESGVIYRDGSGNERFYTKRSSIMKDMGLTMSMLTKRIDNFPDNFIVVKLTEVYEVDL